MDDPAQLFAALALLAFASSTVGTLAGFGGNLIFVPIAGILIGDVTDGILLGLVVGIFNPVLIVARHSSHVHLNTLRVMLLGAIPTAGIGLLVQKQAPEDWLTFIVALVALVAGLMALVPRRRRPGDSPPPAVEPLVWSPRFLLLLLGGVVQGTVATGGPPFVAWLSSIHRDKSTFRSTLCAFWLSMNPVVAAAALLFADAPGETLLRALACLPTSVLGFLVGDRLHARVSPTFFKCLVATLLLVIGVALLLR